MPSVCTGVVSLSYAEKQQKRPLCTCEPHERRGPCRAPGLPMQTIDALTEDALGSLIDEFCWAHDGSLDTVTAAVHGALARRRSSADPEPVPVAASVAAAHARCLDRFLQYAADKHRGAAGHHAGCGEQQLQQRQHRGFEKCHNPAYSAYNDKIVAAAALPDLGYIVTSNVKGMTCVSRCADGGLAPLHMLSTSGMLAADHVASASCIVCSTEDGCAVNAYDTHFDTFPLRKSFVFPSPVTALGYHSGSAALYCGCRDGSVHALRESAFHGGYLGAERVGARRWRVGPHGVSTVAFVERLQGNGTLLVAGCGDGSVAVYDLGREELFTAFAHHGGVRSLVWNEPYRALVGIPCAAGAPMMWDVNAARTPPFRLSSDVDARAAVLVSIGTSLTAAEVYTLDSVGAVKVWCLETLTVLQAMTMDRVTRGKPSCLVFVDGADALLAFGKRINVWRCDGGGGGGVRAAAAATSAAAAASGGVGGVLALGGGACATHAPGLLLRWRLSEAAPRVVCGTGVAALAGCVSCAAELFGELVVGTTRGQVALIGANDAVVSCSAPRGGGGGGDGDGGKEGCAPHSVAFLCTSSARREVAVGYEDGKILVVEYASARCPGAGAAAAAAAAVDLGGDVATCAVYVVRGGGGCVDLLAVGTRRGAVHVVSCHTWRSVNRATSGACEVNAVVAAGHAGAFCSLTAGGRLHVWAALPLEGAASEDGSGGSEGCCALVAVVQKKPSNPAYAASKAEALQRPRRRGEVSLRRPAAAAGAFHAALGLAYIADDDGWVLAVDLQPVLEHVAAAAAAGVLPRQLHGASVAVVRAWRAHAEEVQAVALCPSEGVLLTAGVMDDTVRLWAFDGAPRGTLHPGRGDGVVVAPAPAAVAGTGTFATASPATLALPPHPPPTTREELGVPALPAPEVAAALVRPHSPPLRLNEPPALSAAFLLGITSVGGGDEDDDDACGGNADAAPATATPTLSSPGAVAVAAAAAAEPAAAAAPSPHTSPRSPRSPRDFIASLSSAAAEPRQGIPISERSVRGFEWDTHARLRQRIALLDGEKTRQQRGRSCGGGRTQQQHTHRASAKWRRRASTSRGAQQPQPPGSARWRPQRAQRSARLGQTSPQAQPPPTTRQRAAWSGGAAAADFRGGGGGWDDVEGRHAERGWRDVLAERARTAAARRVPSAPAAQHLRRGLAVPASAGAVRLRPSAAAAAGGCSGGGGGGGSDAAVGLAEALLFPAMRLEPLAGKR